MGCGAGKDASSGSIKGQGSPCLNEYFEKLREFTDEEIKDLRTLAKMKSEKKSEEEQLVVMTRIKANRESFVKVRVKLLTDSFKHHDKDDSGILSEEESKVLFSHITEEKRGHDKILANDCIRKELLLDLGMNKMMFEAMDPSESVKKKVDDEEKKEAAAQYEDVEKKVNACLEEYKKDKENRDKAAFLTLDKSKNGQIEKKEFLEAFDPTSQTHVAFMAALGLNNEVKVKNVSGDDTAVKTDAEQQKEAAAAAGTK